MMMMMIIIAKTKTIGLMIISESKFLCHANAQSKQETMFFFIPVNLSLLVSRFDLPENAFTVRTSVW